MFTFYSCIMILKINNSVYFLSDVFPVVCYKFKMYFYNVRYGFNSDGHKVVSERLRCRKNQKGRRICKIAYNEVMRNKIIKYQ